jgi:hypothetical protein
MALSLIAVRKGGNTVAQFRATIQGNRGEASRLGSKTSGIHATINGWNIGVTVDILSNQQTGKDEIRVCRTGGSNGGGGNKTLAVIAEP